jgi:molybdopterin-guanine dinucleotide biosynthesis protein A
MEKDVSCIILAGGQSRRLGEDKAFIEVGGIRLLDYVYGKCQKLFSEIIIATNQPHQFTEYQATIVVDEIPGAGSSGGLYTGLKRASNDYSFCVGCDMPFLKLELMAYLIEQRSGYDVVIPRTKPGFEPLHALYSKQCIKPMKKLLDKGNLKIYNLLPEVRVRYCDEEELRRIDPSLVSFINVNTKKDLVRIEKMLQGGQWTEKQEVY